MVDYLERAIDRPTLVQAAQHIQKFFYQLKRRRGETMTQWTGRHSESLWEASRALLRVKKDHGFSDSFTDGGSRTRDDRTTQWRTASRAGGSCHHQEEYFDEHGRLIEEEDARPQLELGIPADSWSDWHRGSWRSAEYQPPDSWETDVEDFLPDYLNAFLLLQRSGLDAGERANILAAIHGRFSVDAVSKALKEQWSDDDLLRRDKAKQSAFLTVDDDEPDDDFSQVLVVDMPDRQQEPEAYAAFMEEQTTVNDALAAIEHQKRTLKEARWRQRQVKKSRSFFPAAKYSPGAESFRRGRGHEKCLKCGGPHSSANCPVRKEAAKVVEEEAEVVFSAEETALTGDTMGDPILQGKGIIDCGATSTLGSITVVENIMTQNVQAGGQDRVKVHPEPGPTFRFGNNQTTSCVSSVDLGMNMGPKVGKMTIHVHEIPNQPVLVSVKSLRAVGGVVEFGKNEVIYRQACPRRVVPLETAKNGHLLMPLTGDLLSGARKRASDFKDLHSE